MNDFFLFATALTVSADAFFCGFSMSLGGGKKAPLLAGICPTVLLLCLAAGLLGSALSDLFAEEVSLIGGIILAAAGAYNLFSEGEPPAKGRSDAVRGAVVGLAVGADGAAATLSLTMMGYGAIVSALVIAAAHFAAVLAGAFLSERFAPSGTKSAKTAASVLLFALGAYKILSAFL